MPLLFTHCNLLPLFRASVGLASRAQKKGTVNGNTNHNSCILEKHQSGVLKTLPPETKTGAPRMISGQIVCFIAMHSLPYFYRQPLYRLGLRKASVSFVIFLAADLALLHVFYKSTACKENTSQSFAPLGEIKWESILSGGFADRKNSARLASVEFLPRRGKNYARSQGAPLKSGRPCLPDLKLIQGQTEAF